MGCVDVNETIHMGDCDTVVALVCAMSQMEWVSYLFCMIVMCDSNMYLYRLQCKQFHKIACKKMQLHSERIVPSG